MRQDVLYYVYIMRGGFMSKKKRTILIIVAIVLVAVVALGIFSRSVKVGKNATAELYYQNDYEDIYIATSLTQEEADIIRDMIKSARVVYDNGLSCGFDEHIYLSFADGNKVKKYYIACDTCPFLQYNMSGIVLTLKDWQIDQLHSILGKYGAKFPCV